MSVHIIRTLGQWGALLAPAVIVPLFWTSPNGTMLEKIAIAVVFCIYVSIALMIANIGKTRSVPRTIVIVAIASSTIIGSAIGAIISSWNSFNWFKIFALSIPIAGAIILERLLPEQHSKVRLKNPILTEVQEFNLRRIDLMAYVVAAIIVLGFLALAIIGLIDDQSQIVLGTVAITFGATASASVVAFRQRSSLNGSQRRYWLITIGSLLLIPVIVAASINEAIPDQFSMQAVSALVTLIFLETAESRFKRSYSPNSSKVLDEGHLP